MRVPLGDERSKVSGRHSFNEINLEDLGLNYRPTSLISYEALAALSSGGKNIRTIIGDVKSSYKRMSKILGRMEDYGVVESRRCGRNKIYCITERGEEVLRILDGLRGLLY